jgi:DNA helicase-4
MIVKAVNLIESGKYTHQFKHIFIDEFQDISTTRMLLIRKLLPINNTSMTVVGDDWQSINAFAGSNIKIIQDFAKIFDFSQTIKLDYTFRFNNIVSDIASDFIQKNPHQINKKIKTIKKQKSRKFSILLYWSTGDTESDLIKIIDLIAKKENNVEILVLARYNFLLNGLKSILKNKYPNFDIKFSTVHGSKGNEADYVIVLNIDKGKFGFPSKIEDDPILNLVIPEGDEFEDAEERRLFYVALTRTKKNVFLLSNMYEKSTFIEEIVENYQDEIFFLNDPKIKLISCPECKTGLLRKRKQGKNNNKHFYGCNNFPRCKYTENVQYCPKCNGEIFKIESKKKCQMFK